MNTDKLESHKKPIVTVGIMAFNRKKYLSNAINSAIKQTLNRDLYEIIVVTNFEIPNFIEYKNKFNNFRSIRIEAPKSEPVNLLKYVIDKSQGEYVCFLDDDDLFDERKLERIIHYFKINPKVCYIHNSFHTINNENEILSNWSKMYKMTDKDRYFSNQKLNKNIGKITKYGGLVNHSSISVRKDYLLQLDNSAYAIEGLWDEFMFYWATASNKAILLIPEKLTFYRIHDANSSKPKTYKEMLSYLKRARKSIKSFQDIFAGTNAVSFITDVSEYYRIKEKIVIGEEPANLKELIRIFLILKKRKYYAFLTLFGIYFMYILFKFNYYQFIYKNEEFV